MWGQTAGIVRARNGSARITLWAGLALGSGIIVGVIAVAATAGGSPAGHAAAQSGTGNPVKGVIGGRVSCAGNPVVGYIATFPSARLATVQRELAALPARRGGGAAEFVMRDVASQGAVSTVLLAAKPTRALRATLQSLGPVLLRDQNRALYSCDYLLSDRPAAAPYVQSAEKAVVAAGLMSARDAARPIGEYITADPLDSRQLIVTLDVLGPVVHPPGVPAGVVLHKTDTYSVIESRAHHSVTAVSAAPWG